VAKTGEGQDFIGQKKRKCGDEGLLKAPCLQGGKLWNCCYEKLEAVEWYNVGPRFPVYDN